MLNKKGLDMIALVKMLYQFLMKLSNETKTVLLVVIFIIYFNIDLKNNVRNILDNNSRSRTYPTYEQQRFIPNDNDMLGKRIFNLFQKDPNIKHIIVYTYYNKSNHLEGTANVYFRNLEFSDQIYFNSLPLIGKSGYKGFVIKAYRTKNNVSEQERVEFINDVNEIYNIINND